MNLIRIGIMAGMLLTVIVSLGAYPALPDQVLPKPVFRSGALRSSESLQEEYQ